MDKLATYAVNRVRKTLMPRLLKKIMTRDETGKVIKPENPVKRKRKRGGIFEVTFDSDLHVRKLEPMQTNGKNDNNDHQHKVPNTIAKNLDNARGQSPVSTITPTSLKDDSNRYTELLKQIETHFQNQNEDLCFHSFNEFLQFADDTQCQLLQQKNNDIEPQCQEETHEFTQTPSLKNGLIEQIPALIDNSVGDVNPEQGISHNQKNVEITDSLQQMENYIVNHEDEEKTKNISEETNITAAEEDDNIDYNGNTKCDGICEMVQETEIWKVSLENKYGKGMVCDGCGRNLFDVMTKENLAWVCKHCKDDKCRMMKCNMCHSESTNDGRRGTRAGRRRNNISARTTMQMQEV